MTTEALAHLNRLVGSWTTEATHPALPGLVVHGTAVVEWLEGQRFLIIRTRNDHADFPDSISVIGITDRDRVEKAPADEPGGDTESALSMHYYDSRGVFRVYEVSVDDQAWRLWRDAPRFSQRFTATFADDADTIAGRWQLCRDDVTWDDDVQVTYRRQT